MHLVSSANGETQNAYRTLVVKLQEENQTIQSTRGQVGTHRKI